MTLEHKLHLPRGDLEEEHRPVFGPRHHPPTVVGNGDGEDIVLVAGDNLGAGAVEASSRFA